MRRCLFVGLSAIQSLAASRGCTSLVEPWVRVGNTPPRVADDAVAAAPPLRTVRRSLRTNFRARCNRARAAYEIPSSRQVLRQQNDTWDVNGVEYGQLSIRLMVVSDHQHRAFFWVVCVQFLQATNERQLESFRRILRVSRGALHRNVRHSPSRCSCSLPGWSDTTPASIRLRTIRACCGIACFVFREIRISTFSIS
jgi:hypothetical protein